MIDDCLTLLSHKYFVNTFEIFMDIMDIVTPCIALF